MGCDMQQAFVYSGVHFYPFSAFNFVVIYYTSRLEQEGLLQIEAIGMYVET